MILMFTRLIMTKKAHQHLIQRWLVFIAGLERHQHQKIRQTCVYLQVSWLFKYSLSLMCQTQSPQTRSGLKIIKIILVLYNISPFPNALHYGPQHALQYNVHFRPPFANNNLWDSGCTTILPHQTYHQIHKL